MALFTGAGVAIVTPFNEDESIDFDTLGKMIENQIQNKTDAIVICGTTGEASTLTDKEQIDCVSFTTKLVNKRVPVIAGAGSNHTQHGIELSIACQEAGADGLLLVTPYYNKTSSAGLVKHYSKIADNVNIPIILYNVPGRTGLNISPTVVFELSKHKNIEGIKEASGNLSQVAQIASLCGSDFSIYSGNDDQVLPVLSLGGVGVISVASNVIPEVMHNMVYSYIEGNTKEATKLQLKYLPFIDALFYEVNPIPVKAALKLIGFKGSVYRAPLCEMSNSNLEKLTNEMKAVGLI